MAAESLEEMCSLIVDCPHKTAPIADAPFGYAVGTTAIDATGQIDFAKARPVDQVTYATWTTRAVPQPGANQEERIAATGSVLAAFLAGSQLARTATVMSVTSAAAKAVGSTGRTP